MTWARLAERWGRFLLCKTDGRLGSVGSEEKKEGGFERSRRGR